MIPARPPALVAALLAAAVSAGCTEEIESGEVQQAAGADTGEAAPQATVDPGGRQTFETQLYSERDAVVYSRLGRNVGGSAVPVASIRAHVGDRVERGEVLATLEDEEARLAVEAARPPYRAAAAEFERLRKLQGRNAASAAEVEKARYEMQRMRAALERAELALSRTRIRAPFAGVVSERSVKVGERVTPERPLFRVTALSPLRARLQIAEGHLDDLRRGATVTVRGLDGDTAAAEVVTVAPTIDPASGTRALVIELLEADRFEPGSSVTVDPGGEGATARSGRGTDTAASAPGGRR